ncbi:ARAP2 isoform 9 [Pongo abelii]|uniref:ARAP2 isoform 9 n=1 Tax=Pongo abelii TaxID=9601 RepID=A0A2J8TCM8_PONAB|nr:ARAP2 isoform 9 [Pongo abelii]
MLIHQPFLRRQYLPMLAFMEHLQRRLNQDGWINSLLKGNLILNKPKQITSYYQLCVSLLSGYIMMTKPSAHSF